ncbi:hypothetical protein ACIRVF_05480 [Kitasatospora sp. NPDC101157]|uniref:hypothetical protein n=1 Tax=Kitasatospora sp. NPDC101157 TaxID=3364098 RepID=UPI0037FCAC5C
MRNILKTAAALALGGALAVGVSGTAFAAGGPTNLTGKGCPSSYSNNADSGTYIQTLTRKFVGPQRLPVRRLQRRLLQLGRHQVHPARPRVPLLLSPRRHGAHGTPRDRSGRSRGVPLRPRVPGGGHRAAATRASVPKVRR